MVASRPRIARALQVHNAPGFGPTSSVARAMLYSLMPAGSLLIVPYQLWLRTEWAGMPVGAAMRGNDPYAVAPSILNAPSAGLLQMSRTSDLLSQLLILTQELSPVLARAGGGLHVGIFTAKEDVNEVRAPIAEESGIAAITDGTDRISVPRVVGGGHRLAGHPPMGGAPAADFRGGPARVSHLPVKKLVGWRWENCRYWQRRSSWRHLATRKGVSTRR